jgi:hypothetical protein
VLPEDGPPPGGPDPDDPTFRAPGE